MRACWLPLVVCLSACAGLQAPLRDAASVRAAEDLGCGAPEILDIGDGAYRAEASCGVRFYHCRFVERPSQRMREAECTPRASAEEARSTALDPLEAMAGEAPAAEVSPEDRAPVTLRSAGQHRLRVRVLDDPAAPPQPLPVSLWLSRGEHPIGVAREDAVRAWRWTLDVEGPTAVDLRVIDREGERIAGLVVLASAIAVGAACVIVPIAAFGTDRPDVLMASLAVGGSTVAVSLAVSLPLLLWDDTFTPTVTLGPARRLEPPD
ncbi:MAG: hypothetical protein KC619_07200 [Myxococcales bacterium]|nr:hypothetical protein [Myxococcales bacterium]